MEKITQKTCKKHGNTDFVLEGRGYYRCKQCRLDGVSKRRKNIKIKAVEYKGGKCEVCGYDKYIGALEFHHLDPKKKDFNLSYKGCTRKWETVKKEIDKCALVCSNCHKEIHAKQ